MSLDNHPLLKEDDQVMSQTQDQHIAMFNEQNKVMAGLADYYEAGKSGNEALISSLRNDFNSAFVVGSDRIKYNAKSLNATITRYFGSKVVDPVKVEVFIPEYSYGETLDNVLDDDKGLDYIQTLFNTNDDKDEIKKTLFDLTGKSAEEIQVWTPNQSRRKFCPDRAAFLDVSSGIFRIDGYDSLYCSGRSRGVLYK